MAKRQLASLLDDWWRAENEDRRAVIDDARARADVRQRGAALEAGEIVKDAHLAEKPGATARKAVAPSPLRVLPPHLVIALDTAQPADLRVLLAALADSLEPPANGTASPAHVGAEHVEEADTRPAHAPGDLRLIESTSHDPFVQFWGHRESAVDELEPKRRWRPAQAVLPMTAAVSAVAMAMALIG